jgi:hypothetical protein
MLAQPELVDGEYDPAGIEHTHGQLLAVKTRNHRQTHVDGSLFVLAGEAGFVGGELCHRVDAGQSLQLVDQAVAFFGNEQSGVTHHTVDPHPNANSFCRRVEVDVGRPLANRVAHEGPGGAGSLF